jgi:hypothetical protein
VSDRLNSVGKDMNDVGSSRRYYFGVGVVKELSHLNSGQVYPEMVPPYTNLHRMYYMLDKY